MNVPNCIEMGANSLVSNYGDSNYGEQIFCRLGAWFCESAQKEQKFDVQMWALFGRVRGL